MGFESHEEVRLRWAATVIMFDGEPVYVSEQTHDPDPINNPTEQPGDIIIEILDMPSMRNRRRVRHLDPRIDSHTLGSRLGYVDGERDSFYLSRIPGRQARQGLGDGNVHVQLSEAHQRNVGGQMRLDAFYRSRSLVDALKGNYRSYEDALKAMLANEQFYARAFGRDVCIRRDNDFPDLLNIEYRGQRVCWGSSDNMKLPKNFKYLKEVLSKYGVNL